MLFHWIPIMAKLMLPSAMAITAKNDHMAIMAMAGGNINMAIMDTSVRACKN